MPLQDNYFEFEQINVSGIGAPNNTNVAFAALFNELAQDNISAAGTTQATGTQLTAQTNRLTSVAAGAGVVLPASAPGLEVLIINHGANPVQVYGKGTDQIDDIATATGVSQMASSFVLYSCAAAGNWYTEGLANGYAGGLQTISFVTGITAAGSNQGTATVLTPAMAYNVTTTAASTGVLLPVSVPGAEITLMNNGANTLNVYPNGTDKINALSAGAAFTVTAAAAPTIFYCFAAGQWYTK